jgi:hypothetical protein
VGVQQGSTTGVLQQEVARRVFGRGHAAPGALTPEHVRRRHMPAGTIERHQAVDWDNDLRPERDHKMMRACANRASIRWSVGKLVAASRQRDIWYKETREFTTLLGVVVSCGESSLIDVKADLDERQKINTIAHELGHVALGHTREEPIRPLRALRDLPGSYSDDTEKELEASVWAAHLLVRPEVYEANLEAALQATGGDQGEAVARAVQGTSDELNIPTDTVALWIEHRDATFAVDPLEWLGGSFF